MEPYRDPACDCLLSTTFTGRRRGDVIEGTFVANPGPKHPVQTGTWSVSRQRAP
jgi:hypothetical protein